MNENLHTPLKAILLYRQQTSQSRETYRLSSKVFLSRNGWKVHINLDERNLAYPSSFIIAVREICKYISVKGNGWKAMNKQWMKKTLHP
jgi:hypothetical protein